MATDIRVIVPTAFPASQISSVWTATVSGDDNLGSAGAVQFSKSHYNITGPETVEVLVERLEGASGAISFTVATYNITGDCGMTAGTNYTAVSETVNFAANEIGVKAVDVPINSVPAAGLHLIGLEITGMTGGARIKTSDAYIQIDDGGVNPNATIIDTTTGNIGDIADAEINHPPTSTTGPGEIVVGDIAGTVNAASAGDLIYLRGGTYYDNRRNSGQSFSGPTITNSGTRTAPIQVTSYPGETAKLDQQFSLNDDSAGVDYVGGFLMISSASYIHWRKLEVTRTVTSGFFFDNGTFEGIVIYGNHIHDLRSSDQANESGDNVGGVRLDDTVGAIVAENYIHNIYFGRESSNPFDSEAYGLHSGVHGYDMEGAWLHSNTIHTVRSGMYSKRSPTSLNDGHNMHNNLFYEVSYACHEMGTSGGSNPPGINHAFFRNVCVLDASTGSDVCSVRSTYRDNVTSQPDGLSIYQNTQIGGDWITYMQTMTGLRVYSNILTGTDKAFANEGNIHTYDNLLEYCDYNNYHNHQASGRYLTNRNSPSVTTYNDLAAFQAADQSSDAVLANTPDFEQSATEVVPSFTDDSDPDPKNNDYTTSNMLTSGYANRPQGVGAEIVGETRAI